MNHKTLIAIILFLFVAITHLSADILRGRVVDADTKEPLPEASVRATMRIDDYSIRTVSVQTDSLGGFTLFGEARGTLEVSMLGYYSKSKPFIAFSETKKDTINIGTIELKMSAQMLKMVQVTGHARRFTVKGDTIVFHPEAFHLQEGARLDELIKKLPGVEEENDGSLSWNGQPIRLTMDGESLLGGEELIKKLPAEAVQNLKAYNKSSEFSERTGKNDGAKDMVLDLTIKLGFLDRWYGDLSATYETPDFYETEMTMNRLSKTDPVLVFADANNVEHMHRRTMSRSMTIMTDGIGKEHGLSGGFQHRWNKKSGTQNLKSQYSFSGSLIHNDDWNPRRTEDLIYFPDMATSHSVQNDYQRQHQLQPSLNADLRWARDTLNTFTMQVNVEHSKTNEHQRSDTEQELMGDDGQYTPTLSQQVRSHGDGHNTVINVKGGWTHYVKEGDLGASLAIKYSDREQNSWTQRTITSHQSSLTSSQLSQYSSSPFSRFTTNLDFHHKRWITKKWLVGLQYYFNTETKHDDRDFQTDGAHDADNSYRNRYSSMVHNLQLNSTLNWQPVQLMPSVKAVWQREHQDYQHGVLDTAAVRHSFMLQPSFRATWKLTKSIGLELNYSLSTSRPELIKTLDYRDITNPLYVIEGNPLLKDVHTHDAKLSYNMALARSQSSMGVTVAYKEGDRNQVDAFSYDPASGVYSVRPENVPGSRSWSFRLNYNQGLGDYFQIENDMRLNMEQHYGYLTLLPNQTERTLNKQRNVFPQEKLTVSYDKDWLQLSVFGELRANRLRYSAAPEQNTTQWSNNWGVESEVRWGDFILMTDLTDYHRRGYAASVMNNRRLLWNATLKWKVLKNKATLHVECEDILNQDDGYWVVQSAYQQTTTWEAFHHHYVGIGFTYHLDAKKKD